MSNPVVWFEVMGQDADRLRSFYGELVSWKFKSDNPLIYGFVETGGTDEGGVGEATEGLVCATSYTKVQDLEAAVTLAQRLGSRVKVPITELNDTWIAVLTDPEGNAVGLCADRGTA